MNTRLLFLFIVLSLLCSDALLAQCLNQIDHPSGTQTINEVDVTVTPDGYADYFNLCSESEPYWVGWSFDPMPHHDGSYTFQFSPPVDTVYLNFSYINAENGTEEIIRIYRNGSHFTIPEVFSDAACSEDLAVVNAEGDLAGPNTESHFKGLVKVEGPIEELTVLDSFISGQPLGVSFSIFMCSPIISSSSSVLKDPITISPNPVDDYLFIKGLPRSNHSVMLYDAFGNPQYVDYNPGLHKLDTKQLTGGVYVLQVHVNNKIVTKKLMVSRSN